ncbi:hypothetical protein OHA25_03420 [Nonomuraea sp. NBC_00507]
MDAIAKAQVADDFTVDVHGIGVVEGAEVAVGGVHDDHDQVSLLDLGAGDFEVFLGDPAEAELDGRQVAHQLFDIGPELLRVLHDFSALRVVGEGGKGPSWRRWCRGRRTAAVRRYAVIARR